MSLVTIVIGQRHSSAITFHAGTLEMVTFVEVLAWVSKHCSAAVRGTREGCDCYGGEWWFVVDRVKYKAEDQQSLSVVFVSIVKR